MKLLEFCLVLAFHMLCNINFVACHTNDFSENISFGSKSCYDSKPQKLGITFNTDKVCNEYIVKYHNYYIRESRNKFLTAVFNRAKIKNWRIVSRSNPATLYPSDFDVVQVIEELNPITINVLIKHPVVKSITPHLFVQRTLNYKLDEEVKNSTVTNSYLSFINLSVSHTQTSNNAQYASGTSRRRLLRAQPLQITTILQANKLWELGITGKGVKVAVFDTGLSKDHPHFRRIKERTNWTNEKSLDDGVSHGTFVAGVIASTEECLGFAPDAELHIYRVFSNNQVSYTSWFLDAFNYAIIKKVNILNLSIGGPDFLDYPFVEKVLELSANKIIMVSAIGNDGPLYGTLNNPGDQSDVIGVGGINFNENVAKFSSRGMTTWELPRGYGRLKPDIVTYGSQVKGSNLRGGCRSLSGTSVASPVVAGAVTLIASGVFENFEIVNPSSMKQVLLEGATRLTENNMFEQGHGKLNILKSMELLAAYVPKVTLSPPYLDFSENYMWPYSSQPLYCGISPIIVNVTILNGIAVTGFILDKPSWHPNVNNNGVFLNVSINVSSVLWPWTGWMAVYIAVNEKGCDYEGLSSGYIKLKIQSELSNKENKFVNSTVLFPIKVKIIPKPPRHKRILWDQYHSLRYPPGYLPRDNLKIKSDPLDWNADHIHTNFRDMYNHLRGSGYYIDVLRKPFFCFNASEYGTILIVDPEEEYYPEEILKLQNDVYNHGLSIIVFADWYNTTVMKNIKFFDENTRQWWIPDTGGTNIPALNELLNSFGIEMGDFVAEGYYYIGDHSMYYASGSVITKFPKTSENIVIGANLHDQGLEFMKSGNSHKKKKHFVPILGLLHVRQKLKNRFNQDTAMLTQSSFEENVLDLKMIDPDHLPERNPILNKRILLKYNRGIKNISDYFRNYNGESDVKIGPIQKSSMNYGHQKINEGRIAIFGDSNCLDSTYLEKPCLWLLDALLEFTMNGHVPRLLKELNKQSEFNFSRNNRMPLRLATSKLHMYSNVVDAANMLQKKPLEECEILTWASEHFYDEKLLLDNYSLNEFHTRNYVDINEIIVHNDKVDVIPDGSEKDTNEIWYNSKPSIHVALDKNSFEEVKSFDSFYYLIFSMILTGVTLTLLIRCVKRHKFKRIDLM